MFTDNNVKQENVFQEDEFVEYRYRADLLPFWVKLMAWIGVGLSFAMSSGSLFVIIKSIFSPDGSYDGSIGITLGLIFGSISTTGGLACYHLILEKKWAIYGVLGYLALHLLATVGYVVMGILYYIEGLMPVIVILCLIFVLQVLFLIRLILIFRKWLVYHRTTLKPMYQSRIFNK